MNRHGQNNPDRPRTPALNRRQLYVCCALIACCVVAETLLRWQSGHVLSYLLIPCLALVSLVLLPLMPQSGAWLAVTLYCVGLVSPFPMSYSYSLAMALAAVIIWRDGRATAVLAALLGMSALLVDRKVLFGLGPSDSVVVSFAYCMFAVVIGMVSRWQADRARRIERERRQAERDDIARTLHDRISNDLAYAIMRIDRDLEQPTAHALHTPAGEFRELRGIIEQALADTHQVIDALDDKDDSAAGVSNDDRADTARPVISCGSAALSHGCPETAVDAYAAIVDDIDAYEERLRALGFAGQTTLAKTLPALSDAHAELLAGLLGEVYANIAKHGDPAHGYVVSIAGDGGDIVITAADTPASGSSTGLGLGSGLDRYRRMGVDIHVSADAAIKAGQWSMSARIPAANRSQ